MASTKKQDSQKTVTSYKKAVETLKIISSASLVIAIIAIVIALFALTEVGQHPVALANQTTTTNTLNSNNTVFGNRLVNIDQPLNATSLAVINNASNSYFETAGEMYLNGSIKNPVAYLIGGFKVNPVNGIIINNKPSVIYLGSITCVFCGENRWAMALALSRFGTFNKLYKGYSALQDSDVPTLYWNSNNYNAPGIDLTNHYTSPYINFITLEDEYPITGGFALQPMTVMGQEINNSKNQSDIAAFKLISNLSANTSAATAFGGTPYTIWGNYQVGGADGIVFGNTSAISGGYPAITYMTHSQILNALNSPNDQFSWSEYAAADIYISEMCLTLNNTPSVSACSLPAINKIEQQIKKNSF